jgi:acetyl-CoA acyltransferase
VARLHQVTRRDQEEFAARSHRKTAAAQEARKLSEEIVPIAGPKGKTVEARRLRPPRHHGRRAWPGSSPPFRQDGTVTAGTSSPLTDGASAVLVCSADYAKTARSGAAGEDQVHRGVRLLAGGDGHGAAPRVAEGAGAGRITARDLDVVELNEAFVPGHRLHARARLDERR